MLWKLLLSLISQKWHYSQEWQILLPKGHVRLGHGENILHCLHICCKPHAKGARLGFRGRRGAGQYFSHSQSSEILRKNKTCFQKIKLNGLNHKCHTIYCAQRIERKSWRDRVITKGVKSWNSACIGPYMHRVEPSVKTAFSHTSLIFQNWVLIYYY
jgi:hypothetical protein